MAARLGYGLVRADFNSPLVDTRALPASIWERPAPMPGLELDLDRQLLAIDEWLGPLIAEFRPAVAQGNDRRAFFLDNPWYGPMDAHILYALLRRAPPARVLELGSGYSSLVIGEALRVNGEGGAPARHEVVDPSPSPLLRALGDRVQVRAASAAELPDEAFASLAAGDVLFVDTSHVVRPGGEVVRIVLEQLPALAPGVIVQFHDIYRPFEYPRVFYDVFDVHWQEQYLLQAFLAYNPNFTVLFANHALWRLRRQQVLGLFPTLHPGREPSALWLVRAAPAA